MIYSVLWNKVLENIKWFCHNREERNKVQHLPRYRRFVQTPGQRPSLTWQLAAEQLHAQGAVPPADLGVNAHVLGFNWRGEGAGGRSVIIDVPSENLCQTMEQEQTGGRQGEGGGEGRSAWQECGSRFVLVLCDQSTFSRFALFKVSKLGSQHAETLWTQSLALRVWEEQRMD